MPASIYNQIMAFDPPIKLFPSAGVFVDGAYQVTDYSLTIIYVRNVRLDEPWGPDTISFDRGNVILNNARQADAVPAWSDDMWCWECGASRHVQDLEPYGMSHLVCKEHYTSKAVGK